MTDTATTTPASQIEEPIAIEDTDTAEFPAVKPQETLIESEVLVEDVSIDGMCGVY
jgi:mycofactocin precursor